jgi:hypothetical protein
VPEQGIRKVKDHLPRFEIVEQERALASSSTLLRSPRRVDAR